MVDVRQNGRDGNRCASAGGLKNPGQGTISQSNVGIVSHVYDGSVQNQIGLGNALSDTAGSDETQGRDRCRCAQWPLSEKRVQGLEISGRTNLRRKNDLGLK